MKQFLSYVISCGIVLCTTSYGQNESRNWYFGTQAGLSFSTSPPTVLTNGAMTTFEGCSSISTTNGALLFYTNGITVYNSNHSIMANGFGLQGNPSSAQSGVIVKQPGNANIYFIFSQGASGAANGLKYSTVDMTLAAGLGSVTALNVPLLGNCTEQVTSVRHCNGIDVWVITHQLGTSNIYAFLVTSAGVNPSAVVSSVGSVYTSAVGCMKTSPNGKRLGSCISGPNEMDVFDFDNSTGIVSNPLTLALNIPGGGNGVEFSPDGTKIYGGGWNGNRMYQFDLCAGGNAAIIASQYTFTPSNFGQLQAATDGKIYVAHYNQQFLGVINNPNVGGPGCNYSDLQLSISPKTSQHGLPNFITSYFKAPPPPFTHTVSNTFGCQTASFTAPPIAQNFTVQACVASGYSLTGVQWNFGDPLSGANNTSTLTNPAHAYTYLGTFTAQLILNFSCGGGTDTIKQVVNVNQPCISVSSTSITCASLGSATVNAISGVGPFSYTWMPSAQTSSVATGLSPGSYTITVFDSGNNFTYTASTVFTSLIPLSGNVSASTSLTCNGANTGTATILNLSGGSGNQNYLWTNGVNSYTTAFTNSLSAGLWNFSVTDALTGCSLSTLLLILQPPPLSLVVSANSPTACVGAPVSFTAANSGGSPGLTTPYTYTWTGGPASATYNATQNAAGVYVFTVSSRDSNSCLISQTISANYIPNPTLSVSSVSICPFQTGTLTVSGANSYLWSNSSAGPNFVDNPLVTTQYTVTGTALSCTSAATASIILKPVPVPVFGSNSPICNGQALHLSATTSTASIWTGPASYTSVLVNPTLTPATPINSGVYHVTVTAANSCTAATQGTVTVNPTPTLSATGSTVCVTQTVNLSANSLAGANYVWTGPNSFSSAQQNPIIITPSVSSSGNYTVKVTSAAGCTNTAIAQVTVTALPVVSFTSNSPQCFGNTLNFNANATTGALIYNWTGPNGFNSVLQNPNISNVTVPASGNYTLTVTTGPCVVSAMHSATIHPLPSPIAFNTGPACEGKGFLLGVNNCGVSYQWYGPNGFSSTFTVQNISNVTLSQSGSYSLFVVDANNCQNVATTSVTILQNPIVSASGDLVCFGEPAQLSASGAANYYWTGPANFTATVTNPIVVPTINTQVWTYSVTGTAVNGCTAVTTATLGTRVLPVPTLTVTPRVCVKSEIKFQAQGGDLYQWTGPLNYLSYVQNPVVVAWNIGMAGNYSLMVTDAFGCKGYTTASVIIDSEPAGSLIGERMSGCVPFCSTYSLLASGSSTVNNTLWQIAQQSFSTPGFSYCFTKAGDYEVKGSFENEHYCKGNVNFVIHAFAIPEADFEYSPLKPIENDGPVIFTNTSKGENQNKWYWAFINNQGYTTNSQNTSYTFEDAGQYVVAMLVENKFGCKDTIMKTIEVLPDFVSYVPNAFTPNNDGLNDHFFPILRGVKKYNIQIFDRWGELIFTSDDPTYNWDGTHKGKACAEGSYNWKLFLLNNRGEEKNTAGCVLLYR